MLLEARKKYNNDVGVVPPWLRPQPMGAEDEPKMARKAKYNILPPGRTEHSPSGMKIPL